jgi:hypothetical protein
VALLQRSHELTACLTFSGTTNERFDNWLLTEQLLRLTAPAGGRLLLALDWTQWQDRFTVLTAAVCAGTRAIPVAVSACHKPHLARSQNLWGETFLRLRVDRLRAARVSAVWLCDRGFHRVRWLEKLIEFEQQFVVRLTRDVTVRLADRACLLRNLALQPGERHDYGWVWLRPDESVRVRLIGVWAADAKEAWWVATNLENRVSKVVGYYDRRMGIEEQFRDAKGHRFGLKLRRTQFTKAEFVERMYLLVGVALLLWTTVGRAVEESEPKGKAREQGEGGATVPGTHRLLLLAADVNAAQADGAVRTRTSAAAPPQTLQVAHRSPKVISGQPELLLTLTPHGYIFSCLMSAALALTFSGSAGHLMPAT